MYILPKNNVDFLAKQRGDKVPDFREIKAHQDTCNGGKEFCGAVNFHNGYLIFFGFPLAGAGFFFAADFTGAFALGAGFPLTGALGGGAV